MAGSSMVFTYDDGADGIGQKCNVKKVICDFTSDDSAGNASGTTRKVVGRLLKIVTNPGSAAPSDNWDVAVTDENGISVLAQCFRATELGTRDTTTTEETYLYLSDGEETAAAVPAFPVVCDALTVAVANAGNSKTGQIILYYTPL